MTTPFARGSRGGGRPARPCGCGGQTVAEAWTELEAWPTDYSAPPAFLADQAEWIEVYGAGGTYQDSVRWLLGPEGETLTDGEVDLILDRITAEMTPEAAENFFRSIGRAVQSALPAVGQVAQAALPIVGGAVGSALLPGIGTALGGALGSAAGGLVGQATRAAAPRQRAPAARAPAPPRIPMPAAGAAGGAAQQLLGLLNNPQLLGAVANAALGGGGAGPAGGIDFRQLMGSLARLAEGAAAETMGESWGPAQDSADAADALARRLVGAVRGAS